MKGDHSPQHQISHIGKYHLIRLAFATQHCAGVTSLICVCLFLRLHKFSLCIALQTVSLIAAGVELLDLHLQISR